MKKKILIAFLAIVLFLDSSAPLFAIGRPRTPEKPSTPDTPATSPIKKIEFIHRPRAPRRRSRRRNRKSPLPTSSPSPTASSDPTSTPAPTPDPTATPLPLTQISCPNPDGCNEYGISALHWADPNGQDNTGIAYYVNPESGVGLSALQVEALLASSFDVWEQANISGVLRYKQVGRSQESGNRQDFQNTISFANLNRGYRYRGALAVTSVWYRARTHEIVEFDIVFNSGINWSDNPWPSNCTEYPINTCVGDQSSYDFANVAIHEIGHTLMLLDLYRTKQKELTMYGYAKKGELKKRTLGLGEKTAINLLYP